MKKEQRWASSFSSNFSFEDEAPPHEVMFAGYPDFLTDFGDETDPCEAFAMNLEHFKDILLWADQHPPNFPKSLYSRPVYLCIVFESNAQADAFARDAGICPDIRYIEWAGEYFAEIFGIDLKKGIMNKAKARKPAPKLGPVINFDSSAYNFTDPRKKPKKEISEKLSSLRNDEKNLAKYLEWTAEGSAYNILCFKTQADKDNTLKALGLEAVYDGRFVWCHDVAKAVGVELIPCPFKEKGMYQGREKRLEEMVITPEELAMYRKKKK